MHCGEREKTVPHDDYFLIFSQFCFVDGYQFFKSLLHIFHPMEVFALLNICSVSLLSLVLYFQLVAQELSLRVLRATDEKSKMKTLK